MRSILLLLPSFLLAFNLPSFSFIVRLGRRQVRKLQFSRQTEQFDPDFEPDLYAVLGASRNATAQELKDAYWSIALTSHPDRNNSIEALYIYQNVSHAYSILGRDPKRRQEYDRKLETQEFVGSIGNLTTEVSNIAGPLLNLTLRIAVPMAKAAFEMSSSFFQFAAKAFKERAGDKFLLPSETESAHQQAPSPPVIAVNALVSEEKEKRISTSEVLKVDLPPDIIAPYQVRLDDTRTLIPNKQEEVLQKQSLSPSRGMGFAPSGKKSLKQTSKWERKRQQGALENTKNDNSKQQSRKERRSFIADPFNPLSSPVARKRPVDANVQ